MTTSRPAPLLTPRDRAFSGFPSTGLATAVPGLFFARVLPEITTPEELVVSLYFFFAQTQVPGPKRTPRFVTERELAADSTLIRALANLCTGESHDALGRGLGAAVDRGTLLSSDIAVDGRRELAYVVNSPANRRTLGALTGRRVWVEEPLPPAEGTTTPNIFGLYEENIGTITPLMAEHLQEAEERYPAEWIEEAFREAVGLNKRNWRYIAAILRRWEAEGPDYEKPERDAEADWLARRYASGKRRSNP